MPFKAKHSGCGSNQKPSITINICYPTLQQKNRKMGKNGQEQGRQKMQLSDNEMSFF